MSYRLCLVLVAVAGLFEVTFAAMSLVPLNSSLPSAFFPHAFLCPPCFHPDFWQYWSQYATSRHPVHKSMFFKRVIVWQLAHQRRSPSS